MLGGALAEPVDSALFVWKNSTTEVRTTLQQAPYLPLQGLGFHRCMCGTLKPPYMQKMYRNLTFGAETMQEIEEFVKTDPYVLNGLVTDW